MQPAESELIKRARQLVPILVERAQLCEQARQLPQETLDDFVNAGFYRICQPAAYGGYEMSPEVLFNVSMVLAQGCPSSAWCVCLVGVHNWELGLMDPQAARDMWEKDPDTRFSSSYAPFGKVEEKDGGYQLSGRWQWSSGSDHCNWVMLGGVLHLDNRPEPIAFLVPSDDYEVIDNWHVAGLKGTGSNDIVVKGAFIPAHRTHILRHPTKGAFASPIYNLPFGTIFALCLCAVTQGIAEGALSNYTAYLKKRKHAYDGASMAQDPFQLRRLSEVSATVHANRTRFHSVFRRLEAILETEPVISPKIQIEETWEAQVIANSNADQVTILMRASGGGAQRLDHPMQRYFRDINAGVAHAYLNADRGSLDYADVALKE